MSLENMFHTVEDISEFLSGYYEGLSEGAMSGKICTNVGKDENVEFEKDKQAFIATQFQSLDIIGEIPQLPLCLSNVRLGDSEGKGKGIFAKHEIPEGTVITMYPVDMCEVYDDKSRYLYYSELMMNFTQESEETGQEVFQESVLRYSVDLDSNRKVVALKVNTSNAAFLGHMANDGATDFTSKKAYLTTSIRAHNAVIKKIPDDHSYLLALVATRRIAEGEEIFRIYSASYWFRIPSNINYVEYEDEKCNDIAKQFTRVVGPDFMKAFIKFKRSKRICAYIENGNVVCCAFLINKKGAETDEYKYASIHHHADTQNYVFKVSFMNKAEPVPDFIFSEFMGQVGKRYPCVVFSDVEIAFLEQSGYRRI